ncbi:MAG: hypothetical protein ABI840_09390 [bacterium]
MQNEHLLRNNILKEGQIEVYGYRNRRTSRQDNREAGPAGF